MESQEAQCKEKNMSKKPLPYESISKHYVFYNSLNPNPEDSSIKNITKRENELREAGWVAVPGTFTLDAPQREIVKVEPNAETGKHLAHLIKFLATKHQKKTGTPYKMYANLSVWVNSGDEDGIGEIGIDAFFTSDPEGKNKIGVSMSTYLDFEQEDTYSGLTAKDWLKMDGKTCPIGTPIWTDWHKEIEILINPNAGK